MIELFPDQQELLTELRTTMGVHRHVLLQAATGSGKTVLSAAMIHGARNKGTRSMMTVPRRELLRQSALTFNDYQIPFSYCAAGHQMNPYAKTFLATSGTLLSRIKKEKAPEVNVLIVDETHVGGAGLDAIIQYYKSRGCWIVGLSATPARLDGQGLDRWYNAMVRGKPIRWLIDNGRLSDYRLFAPSTPNLSGIKTVAGDFARGELSACMEADRLLVGDAVRHYRQHAMGKLNIAYCTSRKHSEIVAKSFSDAGIPAAAIDGETPDAERVRMIRAFARRALLVLASCDLLLYGFDLASQSGMDVTVEAMSDLRPTKSLALQLQKYGRVLRKKNYPAIILDHAGNAAAHGLPCEDREWSLKGREDRDGDAGARAAPVKQCDGGYRDQSMTGERMKACFFTHRPAPRCPNCGAWYEVDSRMVEHVDGELQEIGREREPISPEKALKMKEDIVRLTKLAIESGVPRWKAGAWATKKIMGGKNI